MREIKIGVLLSYDYKYLKHSLPCYYPYADKICMAVDKDRKTWSGIDYEIEDSFFDWLKEVDTELKIEIYEENFYRPELSTAECDTRERNLLAKKLGKDGWHIQIDSDEYFADFKGFVQHLRTLDALADREPMHVFTRFTTIFKQIGNEFFVIDGRTENIATATTLPEYSYIRNVDGIKKINSNFLVVHQSWARSYEELQNKLNSWGHKDDFNIESYLKLWNTIDNFNYRYINNFHPLTPNLWPSLKLVKANTIKQLTQHLNEVHQKKEQAKKKAWIFSKLIKVLPYFIVKNKI